MLDAPDAGDSALALGRSRSLSGSNRGPGRLYRLAEIPALTDAQTVGYRFPTVQAIQATSDEWKKVEWAVDPQLYPVEILYQVAALIPAQGMRLTAFEIVKGKLSIRGEASGAAAAFKLAEDIKASRSFKLFQWQMRSPSCGRMDALNSRSKETRKLRRLTKSERRLVILFGLALFVTANFYVISYLLDTETALTQQLSEVAATAKTDQIWLREKQFWMARKQWIDRQQPRVRSGQVPQSELLQALTASAQANQLAIQEQSSQN